MRRRHHNFVTIKTRNSPLLKRLQTQGNAVSTMEGYATKSVYRTNAWEASPEIVSVSRHNDGDSFKLKKESFSEELKALLYTKLERVITKRIMRMAKPSMRSMHALKNGNTSVNEQMQQQIFFCPRRDATFLKCSDMSQSNCIETIFGIPEDSQCPLLDIICYRAEECKQQRKRLRRGPHSDWKRASFIADVQTNEEDVARSSRESTKMLWVDLRELQRENQMKGDGSLFSTEAGVVQFLRSVLTSSHDASPWRAAAEPTARREGKLNEDLEEPTVSSPDIAVCAMNFPSSHGPDDDFTLLRKFRVSDVAPSWFLHAFVHLECLEQSLDDVLNEKYNRACADEPTTAPDSVATLMIYKKLKNRLFLCSNPALSATDNVDRVTDRMKSSTETEFKEKVIGMSSMHTLVEKGCLWEAYETKDIDYGNGVIVTPRERNSLAENRRYRLVSPPYLDLDEEYPGANLVRKLFSQEAIKIFTKDALSVPGWTPWPETAHYKVSSFGNEKPWTVFPLCHCFPANEPDNFTWVSVTKSFVPRTCRLLEEALRYGNGQSYLRTALFSQLAPRSVLEEHTGWADLANHVLRLHIPLVVPSNSNIPNNGDDLCGTWVDGCVETHAVGRPLLFDDSKTHRAFNYSDGDRIVLIVDLARPDRLPLGTAESGHTEELDSFIAQMSVPK